MTITTALIVEAAGVLAAFVAIGTFIRKIIKWVNEQNKQSEQIKEIRAEQRIIVSAMFACLDGLKQLGADGNVTKAYADLQNHLNDIMHEGGNHQ